MVDPEAELGIAEKLKLGSDVKNKGLSLVVFADWYSHDIMKQVHRAGQGCLGCHLGIFAKQGSSSWDA